MRDVGKLDVPASILTKPAPLDDLLVPTENSAISDTVNSLNYLDRQNIAAAKLADISKDLKLFIGIKIIATAWTQDGV